ncbi:MAG: glycosyl hydrolase family 28 protein [Gilvibacter sp.]
MKCKILVILSLILIVIAPKVFSQKTSDRGPVADEIIPYAPPYDPLTGTVVPQNNDFQVEVRLQNVPGSPWIDLFEYNTFVNSAREVSSSADSTPSSYVNFDFTGSIDVKITCNYCTTINSVLIRPQSKEIVNTFDSSSKTVQFSLDKPENLSIELNGNRYKNMHLFSNFPDPGPLLDPEDYTSVAEMHAALNSGGRYQASSGERIYIGGNEVFQGQIKIEDLDDVKVYGRGVIDMQGFLPKRYGAGTGFVTLAGIKVRESSNIEIDGIIINDVNHNGIRARGGTNLEIKNVKVITRVLWGDGINIEAFQNVTIDNCFLRTSDDSISIYPMKTARGDEGATDGYIGNITVTNTSVYADQARPINIGVHGSENINDKRRSENILFENIDILEHDENLTTYQGAISIKSGDYNYHQRISFKDIRIESFTKGRIFNIKIMPKGDPVIEDGYRIQNILLENISAESPFPWPFVNQNSVIRGLNECSYVSGVHFKNLTIDGQQINSIADFDDLEIGDYVHDVTFNEELLDANVSSGLYFIKNLEDGRHLNTSSDIYNSDPTKTLTITAGWERRWWITNLGAGLYKIKSKFDGDVLTAANFENDGSGVCHGLSTVTQPWDDLDEQKWRIVNDPSGNVRIISAWDVENSLEASELPSGNPVNDYVLSTPWKANDNQKWELINLTDEYLLGDYVTCAPPIDATVFTIEGFSPPYNWSVSDNLEITGQLENTVAIRAINSESRELGEITLLVGNNNEFTKELWVGAPLTPTYLNGPEEVLTGSNVSFDGGKAFAADSYKWYLPHPFEEVFPIDYSSDNWQMYPNTTRTNSNIFTGNGGINGNIQLAGVNKCGEGSAIILPVVHGPGGGGGVKSAVFPYPNDADTFFNVDLRSYPQGDYNITMYNDYGRKVRFIECENVLVTVNTDNLLDGKYFLHIYLGKKILKKQLIIKHK